jgi:hypothetical protein
MVRILSFLFLLLTSNSYADNWNAGWHRCGWNSDWYCYTPPSCLDVTETRSLSCPIHQSGSINQVRYYYCTSETWSAWTTSSNNCTQEPPTCVSTIETRNVSCQSGYEGLKIESKTSQCSDPYGSPTWTAWVVTSDSCMMTKTNPSNVESPVSPVSPVSVITPVQTTVNDSVTAIQSAPIQNLTPEVKAETTTSSNKEDTKTQDSPKTQEIVPGLGLVLSIGMLTKSNMDITQPPMADSYNLAQENEYGLQQGIFMGLIIETDIYDRFNAYSAGRNAGLLRYNQIQFNQ